jgi:catechol 2,3-dioxygenase-like lactoylglutathione lyase family enzyme
VLTGLNHITLAVSNIEQSLNFYVEAIGFTGHVKWDSGAYLTLGDLWLCLSLDQPDHKSDYTHIAFDIPDADFGEFSLRVKRRNIAVWKQNNSEGQSIYILDPDGHKLEVHAGNLQSRLKSLTSIPFKGLVWL